MDIAETDPDQVIVAIAAESREFDGLLRRASQSFPASLPLSFAREALINGARWRLVAHGPGPRLAREAAETALTGRAAGAVVSTGYCGALDPNLQAAEIFVATEVQVGDRHFATARPRSGQPAQDGVLVSQDAVASTLREKETLRSRGASAVEMEAGAVAQVAIDRGLPFYCIRAVSDAAGQPMPMDFNRFRRADGRFDRARIAWNATLRPWLWRDLVALDRNCRRASESLGDFLASCTF